MQIFDKKIKWLHRRCDEATLAYFEGFSGFGSGFGAGAGLGLGLSLLEWHIFHDVVRYLFSIPFTFCFRHHYDDAIFRTTKKLPIHARNSKRIVQKDEESSWYHLFLETKNTTGVPDFQLINFGFSNIDYPMITEDAEFPLTQKPPFRFLKSKESDPTL